MPADIAPSPITAMTLFCLPLYIARNRHAEAGGNRRRRVRGAERIVFAFSALGETGQSAALADGADAVAPAGQDLVRIGLVADIPNDAILGRVEYVVKRGREFDHAKTGAQVTAGDGYRVDCLLAQLIGDLAQLFRLELPQVIRGLDEVEQRGFRGNSHSMLLLTTYRLSGGSPNGVYWGLARAQPHAHVHEFLACTPFGQAGQFGQVPRPGTPKHYKTL